MNYFTEYWYVWIIFAIMCVFLFSFYGKKFKQVKEKRKQYEEKLAQEKDMFSHLTSDVFDKIEPIDLTRAVIFHINAKEDRLYEDDNYDGNIIPYLTHEELCSLIYSPNLSPIPEERNKETNSFVKSEKLYVAYSLVSSISSS
jgi:hypothetical protein